MAGSFLHEGERLDELQRNGYKIIQDPKRFCFGMVAVLLVRLCQGKARRGSAGSWHGNRDHSHPFRSQNRGTAFYWSGDQPESADMAARSVAYNHLEDSVSIVTGDIKDATNILGHLLLML